MVRLLKRLGYAEQSQKSTSHTQWRLDGEPFRKVTLDQHNAPYHRMLLDSMIKQMGLSKAEFYRLLDA